MRGKHRLHTLEHTPLGGQNKGHGRFGSGAPLCCSRPPGHLVRMVMIGDDDVEQTRVKCKTRACDTIPACTRPPVCPHYIAGKALQNQHATRQPRNPCDPIGIPVCQPGWRLCGGRKPHGHCPHRRLLFRGWPRLMFIPHKGVDAYPINSPSASINMVDMVEGTLPLETQNEISRASQLQCCVAAVSLNSVRMGRVSQEKSDMIGVKIVS